MAGSDDERPGSHGEWKSTEWESTNSTAYEGMWSAQRAALGTAVRAPYTEWYRREEAQRLRPRGIGRRATGPLAKSG